MNWIHYVFTIYGALVVVRKGWRGDSSLKITHRQSCKRRCRILFMGWRWTVPCSLVWSLFESLDFRRSSGFGTRYVCWHWRLWFVVYMWVLSDPHTHKFDKLAWSYNSVSLVRVCSVCVVAVVCWTSFWVCQSERVSVFFWLCGLVVFLIAVEACVGLCCLWWGGPSGVCLCLMRLQWRVLSVVFPWVVGSDTVAGWTKSSTSSSVASCFLVTLVRSV